MGWDVGGAQLKAVLLDAEGVVQSAAQLSCPLWQGMDQLHQAARQMLDQFSAPPLMHVITMTGELADIFPNRDSGVREIVNAMAELLGANIRIYAGKLGFVSAADAKRHTAAIASANWLASASWLATRVDTGLLIDIGSTTTDLIPFAAGKPCHHGVTDAERMRLDELVYTGVVRTPLMALGPHVPFAGEWRSLVAEHFATTADVYRLSGELDAAGDMAPTADGAGKTAQDSARRLARMIGHDLDDAPQSHWEALALAFREQQISRIKHAVLRCFSRHIIAANAPLIGAGAGRFLVQQLARQLDRPYIDVNAMLAAQSDISRYWAGICLPAYAVARLGQLAAECKSAA